MADLISEFVSPAGFAQLNQAIDLLQQMEKEITDINSKGIQLAGSTAGSGDLRAMTQNVNQLIDVVNKLTGAVTITNDSFKKLDENLGKIGTKVSQSKKAVEDNVGAYKQLSAAYREVANEAKNMAAAGDMTSEKFKEVSAKALELRNRLAAIDASVGVFGRNVGNYKSAFDGIGNSINQLTRELPSAAVGLNTFFLAISNNLGPLQDNLAIARKKNEELAAAGKEFIPVATQISKALFSWNTAITVGITLLSTYGKDIFKFLQGLVSGSQELYDVTDKLKKQRSDIAASYASEASELYKLYGIATDYTKTVEQRRDAVDKLQTIYPDYLGNIDREAILSGQAEKAIERLNNNLLQSAIIKAKQAKIDQTRLELAELEIEKMGRNSQTQFNYNQGIVEGTENVQLNIEAKKKQLAEQEKEIGLLRMGNDIRDSGLFISDKEKKALDATNVAKNKEAALTKEQIREREKLNKQAADAAAEEAKKVPVMQSLKLGPSILMPTSKDIVAAKDMGATIGRAIGEAENEIRLKKREEYDAKVKAGQEMIMQAEIQLAQEATDAVFDIINSGYERQLNALAERQKIVDEYNKSELEQIERSNASNEEKERMKQDLAAQTSAKQAEINKKEAEIKRKQAIADKAASITGIIEKTALAIMNAVATTVPPYSIILAGLYGVMGALQIARVAAAPIPQFFMGTNSSPEGPAIVGEKGREMMISPDGKVGFTPDKATLTYLQQGTKIIPADQTNSIIKNLAAEGMIYSAMSDMWDDSKIIDAIHKSGIEMVRAINRKQFRQQDINFEMYARLKTGKM